MALEKRIVFAPEDIKSLSLICKECDNAVECAFSSEGRPLPKICPWCGAEWIDPMQPYAADQWKMLNDICRIIRKRPPLDKVSIQFALGGIHEAP